MCSTVRATGVVLGVMSLALGGCRSKQPAEMTPVESANLESRHGAISATETLANDLLALPIFASRTDEQAIRVLKTDNTTHDPRFDGEVFTQRLRVILSRRSNGRVRVISEKPDSGQPDSTTSPAVRATPTPNAGFALSSRVTELRTADMRHYLMECTLSDETTRQPVWSGSYRVGIAQ